jgi:hypothetical protein
MRITARISLVESDPESESLAEAALLFEFELLLIFDGTFVVVVAILLGVVVEGNRVCITCQFQNCPVIPTDTFTHFKFFTIIEVGHGR